MENKKDPPRKPADKKLSPMNNNVIWSLLGIGVLTLFIVSLLTPTPGVEISYSDLLKLIKLTEPTGISREPIVVHEPKDKTVRYYDLSDIRIGSWEVTGKVNRAELDAQGPTGRQGGNRRRFPCQQGPERHPPGQGTGRKWFAFRQRRWTECLAVLCAHAGAHGTVHRDLVLHDAPPWRRRLAHGLWPQPRQKCTPRKTWA